MPRLSELASNEDDPIKPEIDRRYKLADLFRVNTVPIVTNYQADALTATTDTARKNALDYLYSKYGIEIPKFNIGDIKIEPTNDKLNFHWGNKMNDVNVGIKSNGDKYINWGGRF